MMVNRAWLLARRPRARVSIADFAYREEPFVPPALAEGEVLVRNHLFSCAPTIRNWLNAPGSSYRSFHDSRREAATTMAAKLSNVLELAAITGHKSLSMLQIYYKPKAADLAARLDA